MTKVVTISDESYAELKKWKGSKSFSETILSLTRANKNKALLETVRRLEKSTGLAKAVEDIYAKRQSRTLKKVNL